MITWLTICGTGERPGDPSNMLNVAASALPQADHHDIVYPASIACFNPTGNISGPSEAESRTQGVAALAAAIRATPYNTVISGYSLGALVVSDFLDAKAKGQYADCEVAAVVNIANPARAAGQSYGLPSVGFGLDGQHDPWPAGIDVYEIANMSDAITSAPWDSPWRQTADDIRRFNIALQGVGAYFADKIAYLDGQKVAQAQANWLSLEFWQAYAAASSQLAGYLFEGAHTVKYTQPHWFNEQGRPVSAQLLVAEVVAKYL